MLVGNIHGIGPSLHSIIDQNDSFSSVVFAAIENLDAPLNQIVGVTLRRWTQRCWLTVSMVVHLVSQILRQLFMIVDALISYDLAKCHVSFRIFI